MKIQNVILSVAKNLLRMQVPLKQVQRFLVVILLGMTVINSSVFAADSTPSADIKIKLDELKKEIASKAAKIKQVVDRSLKDKAYTGSLKTKSPTAITLATRNGPRIVNINQDTEFESKIKNKKFSQKLLAEEDYLAALGDIDETQVLTARKIILLSAPKDQQKTYLWGRILSISDNLVTLKDRTLKSIAVSLSSPAKVNIGEFVILTGFPGKNDIFEAEFVYVIPQGGFLKPARPAGGPKKMATASAQTATNSAKKKD